MKPKIPAPLAFIVKIFFWLFICFLIANIVYAHVKNFLVGGVDFYKYYGISLSGFFLAYLYKRLTLQVKTNVALLFTALILALYSLEFTLLFFPSYSGSPLERSAHLAGKNFDTRSKMEVVEDFRSKGIQAFPALTPKMILKAKQPPFDISRVLPLSGISNIRTVFCNESGKWAIYQSDKYGFNNPVTAWESQDPLFFLLGDSFTHGACVSEGKDLGGQLRKQGLKVINLGMAGSGPLTEFGIYREYVPKNKPSTVIWIYFEGNDLKDLKRELRFPLLRGYLNGTTSQNLMERQDEMDLLLKKFIEQQKTKSRKLLANNQVVQILKLRHLSRWFKGVRDTIRYKFEVSEQEPRPDKTARLKQILKRLKMDLSSRKGQLYFVYLPAFHRFKYPGKQEMWDRYFHRDKVLREVESLGIPIIDMFELIDSRVEEPLSLFQFRRQTHFNARGYALIASAIKNDIYLKQD